MYNTYVIISSLAYEKQKPPMALKKPTCAQRLYGVIRV